MSDKQLTNLQAAAKAEKEISKINSKLAEKLDKEKTKAADKIAALVAGLTPEVAALVKSAETAVTPVESSQ